MATEKSRTPYRIESTSAAAKQLRKLPNDVLIRVDQAIFALSANPRPPGIKKLRAQTDRFRIRIGNYRVIYEIDDDKLVVLIVDVGHRKDIYR